MKEKVEFILRDTIHTLIKKGALPDAGDIDISVSIPQNKEFGDFATNIALVLASKARKPPRDVAGLIIEPLSKHKGLFETIEIAGPGFINFRVHPLMWISVLQGIHELKGDFGKSNIGGGKKVQIEFVSANPTGPLHVGHGRGAAVGDTLVRILRATGFDAQAEYYINDVGNQMNMLGSSVSARYHKLCGVDVQFPQDGYKGTYIGNLAQQLKDIHGEGLLNQPEEERIRICRNFAEKIISEGIKNDLELFNVHFDNWFSESSLYRQAKVDKTLEFLKSENLIYESEEAIWFKSTQFGDEKDRVLKKQDGSLTYFAPDIAYHKDKLDRGFEKIIDIWGADHHGYVPRMQAAIEALGAPRESFHALLIQLVSLERSGKPVYMSTRAGEFVTLQEIINEVGKDAARYFFLMRRCDSHLIFDLELAKKKSEENPVFYIQYAHARICSILNNARAQNIVPDVAKADLGLLSSNDNLELIKVLASFPDVLNSSAQNLEPHRIAFYLLDLATIFHKFYNKNRVISDKRDLTMARLVLIDAVRQVICNAFSLMGISAPESM